MKHILLLTDFSENSINAIRYGLKFFENDNCSFLMLHVHKSTSYLTDDLMLSGSGSIYDSIIGKSKNKLQTLLRTVKKEFNNKKHVFKCLVDYDVLTDAIKQIQKSEKIDCIVMGTNGETGAREVLFGSNTINVVRKINCPTLIIPEKFKYKRVKQILLPLDSADSIKDKAFMESLNFTNHLFEKLHILRIETNSDTPFEHIDDKENLNRFLENTHYEYHLIKNISMEESINCYEQTHDIDLLILIEQTKSFFERLFSGSETKKVTTTIRIPLFIFHSQSPIT